MGQGSSAPEQGEVLAKALPLHPHQLSEQLVGDVKKSKRLNNYPLANRIRMEVFERTELRPYYAIWAEKERQAALTFSKLPYHAGNGFIFGMCYRVPVDFYQGWKAANWRWSGGVGRVQRESHYAAGRFGAFLGVLYFYETIIFKISGRHGKEETCGAAFCTAATLAAHTGWKSAATQGAIAAGFMYCLISFTEWLGHRLQTATVME
eukprot:TRINITY_DN9419_c0_g1_i1.p1 TRINITY_DN9419_c0_g1~~TRINITY_DN9419_c0_g1_i1.p1  ORF type:complete len:207 (+),score=70.50 TRINITY_DN9419_c0_g1_i1:76-696(+)